MLILEKKTSTEMTRKELSTPATGKPAEGACSGPRSPNPSRVQSLLIPTATS